MPCAATTTTAAPPGTRLEALGLKDVADDFEKRGVLGIES